MVSTIERVEGSIPHRIQDLPHTTTAGGRELLMCGYPHFTFFAVVLCLTAGEIYGNEIHL
jgi:hypothetical protein